MEIINNNTLILTKKDTSDFNGIILKLKGYLIEKIILPQELSVYFEETKLFLELKKKLKIAGRNEIELIYLYQK